MHNLRVRWPIYGCVRIVVITIVEAAAVVVAAAAVVNIAIGKLKLFSKYC